MEPSTITRHALYFCGCREGTAGWEGGRAGEKAGEKIYRVGTKKTVMFRKRERGVRETEKGDTAEQNKPHNTTGHHLNRAEESAACLFVKS